MKILPAKSEQSFQPISVTFVFETQDEIDAMASLFNVCPVCDGMASILQDRRASTDAIRNGLKSYGADASKYVEKIKTNLSQGL